MGRWVYDLWLLQWFGVLLIGGGLIGIALFGLSRRQRAQRSGEVGIGGDLPAGPGINISRVALGGDAGGLLVVVGVLLAFAPMLWGWFLGVAVGAVVVAAALFLWHRHHPR